MNKISETILFFGSGPVAAKSLRLLAANFSIEAVITKPRPLHHKGDVPVLTAADNLSLAVHTVTDKQSLDMLCGSQQFKSRLSVLIDFGIIVSENVISKFPLGIINSHFSLLPQWRGADPITFSILSGQKVSGVSLMLLVPRMDEGPLLAQEKLLLDDKVTTPLLTDKLIELSSKMLIRTIPEYFHGSVKPFPQSRIVQPSYSRRLTKEDGKLDWTKPAMQLEREVRAFIGWPGSYTRLANRDIIVTEAGLGIHTGTPGSVIRVDHRIFIVTAEGSLEIIKLKPAGRPEMTAMAFLAGNAI